MILKKYEILSDEIKLWDEINMKITYPNAYFISKLYIIIFYIISHDQKRSNSIPTSFLIQLFLLFVWTQCHMSIFFTVKTVF